MTGGQGRTVARGLCITGEMGKPGVPGGHYVTRYLCGCGGCVRGLGKLEQGLCVTGGMGKLWRGGLYVTGS